MKCGSQHSFQPIKAAMFLSCLATDISVGLGSWVEPEENKKENETEILITDQLEIMRSVSLKINSC